MNKFNCCKHCLHIVGKGHARPCNFCVADKANMPEEDTRGGYGKRQPMIVTKRVHIILPTLAAGVLLGDLFTGHIPIVGIAIAYTIGDLARIALRKAFPQLDDEKDTE